MTDFNLSFSHYFSQRNLAGLVFLVVLANLIIGGIILPYQQLQRAQAYWSSLGIQIPQWILDIGNYIYQGIQWAYNNAQQLIQSAALLWQNSQAILKAALKVAWNILRKKLLNMLVNDIVTWIQGGGKPRFVTDWQSFLKNAADKAGGQFLDTLGLGFLCDGFSVQLRLALATPAQFDETATCTISTAIDNLDNFMTDFSKGGWKGWIAISESQNNYMGAYFMALDEKYTIMDKAAEAAKNEAASSASFVGSKVCSQRQCSPGVPENYSGSSLGWKEDELGSCECLTWVTVTPGRVAGDALQQALGVDIANLIQAKEWEEYAAAILDAAINRVIREGVSLVASTEDGTSAGQTGVGISTTAKVTANISDYASTVTDEAQLQILIPQLKLLKENQNKVLTEYQTNLGILNQTKTSQENGLNILINLLRNGCSLPNSVSITTISGTRKKLVATGTGEAILEGAGYTIISITADAKEDITAIITAFTNLQSDLTKLATAVTDASDYQIKAKAYITAYEAPATEAVISAAKTAMDTARAKAITSLQTAIPSMSTTLKTLTEAVTTKSNTIATKIGELVSARGAGSDCTYYTSMPASLYKDLCTARANEATWQVSLNNCLNP